MAPAANSFFSSSTGTGRKLLSTFECARIRRAVVEEAEQARDLQPSACTFRDKALDAGDAVMRDDLRQVELRGRVLGSRWPTCVAQSPCGFAQPPSASAGPLAGSHRATARRARRSGVGPRVCPHRGRPGHRILLMRPIRVGETVVHRVLAGQERHHAGARDIDAQVDQQVTEVVFLLEPHRAVSQEDLRAAARQALAPRGTCRSTRPCWRVVSSSARGGRSSAAMTDVPRRVIEEGAGRCSREVVFAKYTEPSMPNLLPMLTSSR